MKQERWQQVRNIFDGALEHAPHERSRFLDKACANDEVRREVESLLSSLDSAEGFMETPAVAKVADVIGAETKKLKQGKCFGHYEIIEQIGAGGMGEVYLAEDTRLDRKVAIKFLNEEFSRAADKLNRFIQEAKSASALNHPNILTVHEIGKTDDSNYIVTEFIEGKTLRGHLSANESISLSAILKIGVQAAEALSAAHQAGIIHRDIKPENIMIRADGYAKVLDFGLAKLTEKKKSDKIFLEGETKALVKTNPGVVMGTVLYMSPEQARGRETDARTDLWSLGVVLYEMLSGKVPFAGETINHTIVSILEKEPLLLENVPDELQRIVRKTLSKEAEMRYQTARDLLIDLKNLRRTLDIQGELERSVLPNREAATDLRNENANRSYSEKSNEETNAEAEDRATQNITSSSSLEYAVIQAKSHKFVTATVGIILLSIVSAIAYFGYFAKTAAKQIESIAVMPFVNESGNQDAEYLSDGMTETLIKSLSNLPNLSVKARSSVFRYKGKDTDLQTIAKELSVQAILNGRVVQRGDQLTLNLELIDAQTENVIWAESYNRKQSDLVSLQSEIAKDVSTKLKTKLSGAEETKVTETATSDPQAYQAYLKGRYYWNKRTEENLNKAIEQFKAATDKDPNYALAYAGLADCYSVLPSYTNAPSSEFLPYAKTYATRAIAIDDSLGEAHVSLAFAEMGLWNWAAAEKEFKRGLELSPNYFTGHQWYGSYLATKRRFDEALTEYGRAQELEPLSLIIKVNLAQIYLGKGDADSAIEACKRAIELDSNWSYAHRELALIYIKQGLNAEALAAAEKAVDLTNRQSVMLGNLGYVLAQTGKRSEALQIAEELKDRFTKRQVRGSAIGLVYLGLKEKDETFSWLEKDLENLDSNIPQKLLTYPLNTLRDDPRYKDLLKRMNLPE